MRGAFVDTSVLLAETFAEVPASIPRDALRSIDVVMASRLLEAEFLSACSRERLSPRMDVLDAITWIDSTRSLTAEISRVLAAGYVNGADCWHLATALSVAPDPGDVVFLTLHVRQRVVAKKLGFRV